MCRTNRAEKRGGLALLVDSFPRVATLHRGQNSVVYRSTTPDGVTVVAKRYHIHSMTGRDLDAMRKEVGGRRLLGRASAWAPAQQPDGEGARMACTADRPENGCGPATSAPGHGIPFLLCTAGAIAARGAGGAGRDPAAGRSGDGAVGVPGHGG